MSSPLVTATIIREGLTLISRRNVTVVGAGVDACHHALCLRDSGLDVRLGLAADDPAREVGEAEGLEVLSPQEACEQADLIVVVAPAHLHESLYAEAIDDNLVPGDMLVLADGHTLRYESLEPAEGVDVAVMTSVASNELMRREYAAGHGVPMLVAVHTDASGHALAAVAGLAVACGGPHATVVECPVGDLVDAAGLASTMAWREMADCLTRTQAALSAGGVNAFASYLATVGALQSLSDAVAREGLSAATSARDPWTRHLAASSAGSNADDVLTRLRDGSLAREYELSPRAEEPVASVAEEAGSTLRALMPWLDPRSGGVRSRWR